MIVRTFMPRFHALVESGAKRQTVRGRPKRMPKIGEVFDGRAWTGKPYRSPQRRLVRSEIARLQDIEILRSDRTPFLQIVLDGVSLCGFDIERFAGLDGFEDAADMYRHFQLMKRFPLLDGIVIHWM